MNEENYLKYKILLFVNTMERTHNIHQLKQSVMGQLLDTENYVNYFDKSYRYLRDNGFINGGVNNSGWETISSLTEKGESVLKFDSWEDFSNEDIGSKLMLKNINDDIFTINENGDLIYDEDILFKKLLEKKSSNQHFINPNRLIELNNISNNSFDLSKLIRFCEELDYAFLNENYLSVGVLMRAIIDHIPPIFGCKNFSEVSNNYNGTKSFKKSMEHLNVSLRNISDSYLHTHIRKKETLPNKTQIDFSSDMDVLLSEIIRILD